MVVDDIVVVGAKPLFMTDYIACGKVVPERIADIVARHRARAAPRPARPSSAARPAEHPGLLGPDDYDVAGAATGVVEADARARRRPGRRRRRRARAGELGPALQRLLARAAHRRRRRHPVRRQRRRPRRRRGARRCSSRRASTRGRCCALIAEPRRPRCTRSATSPAAASPPTSRACCRRARGSRSTARPGRRRRCSACSPTWATSTLEADRGHLEPRHRVPRGRGGRQGGGRGIRPLARRHRDLAGGRRARPATAPDGHCEQGAKGVDGGAVRLVGSRMLRGTRDALTGG